jgi:methionyl-tRNA formyltransferase
MRIVFFGTPDFSVGCLEHLLSKDAHVVAVVTQPDRPKGRGLQLAMPPVKQCALTHNLPVWQPEDLRDPAFLEWLQAQAADLFVVVAFSLLPRCILEIPKLGCINVHGSLLPLYRGAAPVQWAIACGEQETGVTIFLLDQKMDHGPVLVRAKCPIDSTDDSNTLFIKLEELGKVALWDAIQMLQSGQYEALAQDDTKATKAPKLTRNDGVLDWSKPAIQLERQIRAFIAYPTCFGYFQGKVLKITRAKVCSHIADLQPGQLLWDQGSLFVGTGCGTLELLQVQPEGKKAMSPVDFINGLRSKEDFYLRQQP